MQQLVSGFGVPDCNVKAASAVMNKDACSDLTMLFERCKLAPGGDTNLDWKAFTINRYRTVFGLTKKSTLKAESMGEINALLIVLPAGGVVNEISRFAGAV